MKIWNELWEDAIKNTMRLQQQKGKGSSPDSISDSAPQHGSSPDSASPPGSSPNSSQHGSSPDSISQHGSSPDSASQHGSSPDSTSQHGSSPDSTSQLSSSTDPTSQPGSVDSRQSDVTPDDVLASIKAKTKAGDDTQKDGEMVQSDTENDGSKNDDEHKKQDSIKSRDSSMVGDSLNASTGDNDGKASDSTDGKGYGKMILTSGTSDGLPKDPSIDTTDDLSKESDETRNTKDAVGQQPKDLKDASDDNVVLSSSKTDELPEYSQGGSPDDYGKDTDGSQDGSGGDFGKGTGAAQDGSTSGIGTGTD